MWESAVTDLDIRRAILDAADAVGPEGSQRAQLNLDGYLRQRVWNDLSVGTLSSDGELVFTLEEVGLALQPTFPPPPLLPYNKLMAFELRTRQAEMGSRGTAQPDDGRGVRIVLSRTSAPRGRRVSCLVENGSDILLAVLDAATGRLRSSQGLVAPEHPLSAQWSRRLNGLSPSFKQGIVVCPTGAGAVVAIDLATRRLLWGYRYASNQSDVFDQRFLGGGIVNFNRDLQFDSRGGDQDQWLDGAPTIAGDKVILTSYDSEQLVCLDLLTGAPRWQKPRDGGLYVAAVLETAVVVVSHNRIDAWKLDDGQPAWKRPAFIRHPSGTRIPLGKLLLHTSFNE